MGFVTGNAELNQLRRITPAAVNDGIGQCLPESHFHFKVTLRNTVRPPDALHHPVDHRFYSVYVAWNGQLHMMEELLVLKLAAGKTLQRALIFLGDEDSLADLGPRVELKGKRKASRNLQVIQRLIEISCDSQRSS